MSYLVCHQSIKCHQRTYYNDIQWHSNCLNSNILTTSDDIRWHRSRSWRIPDHKECKSIPKVANMVYSGIPIWSTLDFFGMGTSGWAKTNGIPLGFHWGRCRTPPRAHPWPELPGPISRFTHWATVNTYRMEKFSEICPHGMWLWTLI